MRKNRNGNQLRILIIGLLCVLLAGAAAAFDGGEAAPGGAYYTLTDAAALLGRADGETAELFSGGESYRTEDHGAFLGRMYQTELYGQPVTLFTACGGDGTVEAVSVRVTGDGERTAAELLADWQDRVTAYTGAAMRTAGAEAAPSYRWTTAERICTLRLNAGVLTVGIHPAAGELR
ncbi:hypothetical protein [Dysosmobacter sp.]|uniref:hypothetical protein n=1 Tax=Dysosmobacter sp. TaxID=2591382 RepID=UPI002A867FEE|nr:hypothetical protein [Dysosmobacter sp.]MDY3281758.1 hypothetical protein [Dysosmobacter sp.]